MYAAPVRILLVAATEKELPELDPAHFPHLELETLVSGVGMVATAFHLTRTLASSVFDIVLNVGIAGSFVPHLPIGSVVQVNTDRLVELGVEDNDRFIPADELGLVPVSETVFHATVTMPALTQVRGITVNCVHGRAESIARVKEQFDPEVETMEGAAVGYVCTNMDIRWAQVRAISNRVEPRDRSGWDVPLAIERLHGSLVTCLQQLEHEN